MRSRTVLATVLALAVGLGAGWAASSQAQSKTSPVRPPLPAASATSGSFAKLAEAVKPAVINVSTQTRRASGRTPLEEFYGEDFFKRFFGDAPERLPRRGLGSGVIIDPSGIALTNAHVVDGATSIEVVTVEGAKYSAKVLGTDKQTDLAVLQLENGDKTFPFLSLGNSDETEVGEWVIAVGSPFGLQATVTSGIISAKARQIGAGPYDDFLQTDAAINPGNSGGPLVNMRGEVVGINTAIVRGASGIGFAIPSSMAKRIASELRTSGKITRGWLGVSVQSLTSDLARSFGTEESRGALIADVSGDSPAARAGLQPGDIVVKFNDRPVENSGDLARAVALAKPGETGRLTLRRSGDSKTVDVKLGTMPSARTEAATGPSSKFGLAARTVTPEVARELDLESSSGVVVMGVEPGTPAAEAGVRRGDVITEVDRKPVKSVDDFERLTAAAEGKQVLLRLERQNGALYVTMARPTA